VTLVVEAHRHQWFLTLNRFFTCAVKFVYLLGADDLADKITVPKGAFVVYQVPSLYRTVSFDQLPLTHVASSITGSSR